MVTAALLAAGGLMAFLAWPVGTSAADTPRQATVPPLGGHFGGHPAVAEAVQLERIDPTTRFTEPETWQAEDLHANPVFARNVAGTWVEVGNTFSTTINIAADGTLEWFGSWFFGNGTQSYIYGPVYGIWRQTGPLKLTTIEVGYLYNGDGSFYGTGRVREVLTFSPEFQTWSYAGREDVFLPGQDPTDPNEVPAQSFTFSGGPVLRLPHMN